jgi:MoxR-like ATPase
MRHGNAMVRAPIFTRRAASLHGVLFGAGLGCFLLALYGNVGCNKRPNRDDETACCGFAFAITPPEPPFIPIEPEWNGALSLCRSMIFPENRFPLFGIMLYCPPDTNWSFWMRFEGTAAYVADKDLMVAVNAAIALERPLLVKGEPGTGKTELARQVAAALGLDLLEWNVKSTTKAQQGLYEYDAVSRLRDSQLGDDRFNDIRNYIKRGKLWDAFTAAKKVVLLIDEIDKADIEFPNDLLQELDRMEFFVYETGETIRALHRPIVIITSNNEKELPDAFLRRCFFHYIRFPDVDTLHRIVDVHYPGIKQTLVHAALTQFYEIREVPGLKKKPSTSEALDWIRLLVADDIAPEDLRADPKNALPKLHGALLKNEQDVHLFERLAFMARRQG